MQEDEAIVTLMWARKMTEGPRLHRYQSAVDFPRVATWTSDRIMRRLRLVARNVAMNTPMLAPVFYDRESHFVGGGGQLFCPRCNPNNHLDAARLLEVGSRLAVLPCRGPEDVWAGSISSPIIIG